MSPSLFTTKHTKYAKALLGALVCLVYSVVPLRSQTARTRAELLTQINTQLASGQPITAAQLRAVLADVVASAHVFGTDGTSVVTSGSYANPAWLTALPISTVTGLQTALDGKEPALGNPASNGYVLSSTTGGTRSWVSMSGGGGTWGSITGTLSAQTDLQSALDGKLGTSGTAADVNPAGTSIAAALAGKLSTSGTAADVNPAGTSIASALGGKESTISAGTTGQYWRGDKSWQTLNATAVGLGSVENPALSTWAGSTNIVTLGNVTTGTWSGTTVAVAKGGTGATTHTAGAVLIGAGSSAITSVAPGTSGNVLTSNGTAWTSATASAGGTKTYAVFRPTDGDPPASNYATFDTRNSIPVLAFDKDTAEAVVFSSVMPEGASLGSGLKVRIHVTAPTLTSGVARWAVKLERMTTDLDSDSWDTAVEADLTVSGTSGIIATVEITITTIDSITAGDPYRLHVSRAAAHANDTLNEDAQLVLVEVRSAS